MSYLAEVERNLINATEENRTLRKRVAELEIAISAVAGAQNVPRVFRLTNTESRVFEVLLRHSECSQERLHLATYSDTYHQSDDELPTLKIIDVYICKIRKKIARFDCKIETLWGRGYTLPSETRRIVGALCAEANDATWGVKTPLPKQQIAIRDDRRS